MDVTEVSCILFYVDDAWLGVELELFILVCSSGSMVFVGHEPVIIAAEKP